MSVFSELVILYKREVTNTEIATYFIAVG